MVTLAGGGQGLPGEGAEKNDWNGGRPSRTNIRGETTGAWNDDTGVKAPSVGHVADLQDPEWKRRRELSHMV